MYDMHQVKIERYAKANADNWFKTIQFVLLTIQQPLWQIPEQMKLVNAKGSEAHCLWGVKGRAWAWHQERMHETYDYAMMLDQSEPNPEYAAHDVLMYLASLPGLGLAKGGFLAQCVFGLVGCLDSHNIERFNLSKSQVSASAFKQAKTVTTRQRKVTQYLDLCNELGGCKGLWDSWCSYVYERNAHTMRYDSAMHVSATHCEALGI
jgi:hypothetical protein